MGKGEGESGRSTLPPLPPFPPAILLDSINLASAASNLSQIAYAAFALEGKKSSLADAVVLRTPVCRTKQIRRRDEIQL